MLTDLVAPVRCVACAAAADGDLCRTCAEGIEVVGSSVCLRCGGPGDGSTGCVACAGLGGFTRARSLINYAGPARHLVVSLKRRGHLALATDAGRLLADLCRLHALADQATTVTWVPSGRSSRHLGFDHARLLADAVARDLDISCRPWVRRLSEGKRQADVGESERLSNASARFGCDGASGRVLLIDDVYTTGSTASVCASALIKAGAVRVDVCTLARTVRRVRRSGNALSRRIYLPNERHTQR